MLVAYDLGQHIGWVKGNAVGPMTHGVIHLPTTTDLGLWLAAADDGIRSSMRGATAVAMEQPFMGENWYPLRKLAALLGHIHYFAHHYGISIPSDHEIPVPTGKLALAGHGHADKAQMVAAAARNYGLNDLSEHEADALGIWCVWQFGRATPIRKPRTRSSKAVVVKP